MSSETQLTYGQKIFRNAYQELSKPMHQQLFLLPILRFIFKITQPLLITAAVLLLLILILQCIILFQLAFLRHKVN